jgi:rubrerythrin
MPNEQDVTLKALQTALKMEVDGKKFYLKASKSSKNELGQELFAKLAAEEDVHRGIFQKIYDGIKAKKGWPDVKYKGDSGQGLRTVFAEALEGMEKNPKNIKAELDAIKVGMELENKTYDFYKERSAQTDYATEKELYESIAMQESEHYRVLQDYYEFLQDPAQWYVKTEHTSVDGG